MTLYFHSGHMSEEEFSEIKRNLSPDSRVRVENGDREYEIDVDSLFGENQGTVQNSAFYHNSQDREILNSYEFELQVSSDEGSTAYDLFMSPETCYLRVQRGPTPDPSWNEIAYDNVEVL